MDEHKDIMLSKTSQTNTMIPLMLRYIESVTLIETESRRSGKEG